MSEQICIQTYLSSLIIYIILVYDFGSTSVLKNICLYQILVRVFHYKNIRMQLIYLPIYKHIYLYDPNLFSSYSIDNRYHNMLSIFLE